MDHKFSLEVLPDENSLEVPGEVEESTFNLAAEDDIIRPGENNEIIRDRRY